MNSNKAKFNEKEMYQGYLTLISVIIMMSITSVTLVAMMLLSTSSVESSKIDLDAVRARKAAETCAEIALTAIRTDYGYLPGHTEQLTTGESSCEVINVLGTGNNNRTLQLEGYSGNSTQRLVIGIQQINPIPEVSNWEFVSQFN